MHREGEDVPFWAMLMRGRRESGKEWVKGGREDGVEGGAGGVARMLPALHPGDNVEAFREE